MTYVLPTVICKRLTRCRRRESQAQESWQVYFPLTLLYACLYVVFQDYEQLQPRLDTLRKSYDENIEHAARLEKRIAAILERHSTQARLDFPSSPTKSYQRQVDALSELFVAWDDTLTDAEHKITKLERERAERRRMGLQ